MEGFGGLQTTVVSVDDIDCCKACPKIVKKSLLKIKGVRFVTVDVEKKLVSVEGNVDPQKVVYAISEMGKEAKLLSDETMDDKKKQSGINKVGCSNDQCDAKCVHNKVKSYFPPSICNDPCCNLHKRWAYNNQSLPSVCISHNGWAYNQFSPSVNYGGDDDKRRGKGCIVM